MLNPSKPSRTGILCCADTSKKNCYVITSPSCQVRNIYPSKSLCTFLLFPSFDECSLIMSSLSILNKSSLGFFFLAIFFPFWISCARDHVFTSPRVGQRMAERDLHFADIAWPSLPTSSEERFSFFYFFIFYMFCFQEFGEGEGQRYCRSCSLSWGDRSETD